MAAAGDNGGGIIAGINVTPMVDVTLVLLIIFMVTAKIIAAPAVALYGLVATWLILSEPPLSDWGAELALRVHAELLREQSVELEPPRPPPEPPRPPPEAPRPPPEVARVPAPRRAVSSAPPPPA